MIGLDPAMMELFREEVRTHAETLSAGLLELEADPQNPQRIEPLMRAAHSIKGACRIVNIDAAVRLAHVMEDFLVAAQTGKVKIQATDIDLLLQGTDLLAELSKPEMGPLEQWASRHESFLTGYEGKLGTNVPATTPNKAEPNLDSPAPIRLETPTLPLSPLARQPVEIPTIPLSIESIFDQFREEVRQYCLQIQHAIEQGRLEELQDGVRLLQSAAKIMGYSALNGPLQQWMNRITTLKDFSNNQQEEMLAWNDRFAAAIHLEEDQLASWFDSLTGLSSDSPEELEKAEPQVIVPTIMEVKNNPEPAPIHAVATTVSPVDVSAPPPRAEAEAVVRVTAASLNRLMGLAGESLIQARWLQPFSSSLTKLKKQQDLLAGLLDNMTQILSMGVDQNQLLRLLNEAKTQSRNSRQTLTDRMSEFESHAAQAEDLNSRLYHEVIDSRMRPFGDGIHGLPRLVRDMSRALGKQARLVIEGQTTEVDRDILEKLEAPLTHLVRNAVDHGLEMPEIREQTGKPLQGTIRIQARHRAGMLVITIADDGAGVNLEKLKKKIVERGLNTAGMLESMTEAELLEFLFLPGFSTAKQVSEYSGRGVGLDVVQEMVRKVGGSVRVTTTAGQGTTFHLQLPITLSVLRAVLVEVAGDPYALPHNRIDRLVRVQRSEIHSLEHRHFVTIDGQNIGLVLAAQLLELSQDVEVSEELSVVLLSDNSGTYGLVVDAFRGEQDLVVRPLDLRLGKVPNLSAAAILDDGLPVLIIDVEDLIRSMDQYIQSGSLKRYQPNVEEHTRKKRVLVVDDSITVREVERQLLIGKGYEVTLAYDGMDGWNRIRAEKFDLLISDVDMPRMTGLQLVRLVRQQDQFKELPIIIISYKEREEDKLAGLDAGANYYLTKSSFHDDRFLTAVQDLIGD